MSTKLFLRLVISAALLAAGTVARASDPDNGGAWNYEGAIYLWGAGIGGETAANEDIDIAFKDLWDNLDAAFMGTLSARKGRWSLLGDVIYMDVSGGKSKTIEIGDRPVPVSVGVDMESWILLGGAGYTVHETDATSLAVMGGARYLWLELGFDRRIVL